MDIPYLLYGVEPTTHASDNFFGTVWFPGKKFPSHVPTKSATQNYTKTSQNFDIPV